MPTLIIGAKCKDGLVIGSDRRIIRGGETEYSNKIFEFDIGGKVIFAAEGLTGLRDDFFYLLNVEIRRRRGVETLYEVKLIVEDIIADLTERYKDRVGEDSPVAVIMGGFENLNSGNSNLYFIHGVGYGEQVTMRCSGHGGQYAYSLAKFLCDPRICAQISVEEIAKRIAFIILWVSDDVDSTVGGTPSVAMLRENQAEIEYLSDEILKDLDDLVGKRKKELPSLFFNE